METYTAREPTSEGGEHSCEKAPPEILWYMVRAGEEGYLVQREEPDRKRSASGTLC